MKASPFKLMLAMPSVKMMPSLPLCIASTAWVSTTSTSVRSQRLCRPLHHKQGRAWCSGDVPLPCGLFPL